MDDFSPKRNRRFGLSQPSHTMLDEQPSFNSYPQEPISQAYDDSNSNDSLSNVISSNTERGSQKSINENTKKSKKNGGLLYKIRRMFGLKPKQDRLSKKALNQRVVELTKIVQDLQEEVKLLSRKNLILPPPPPPPLSALSCPDLQSANLQLPIEQKSKSGGNSAAIQPVLEDARTAMMRELKETLARRANSSEV